MKAPEILIVDDDRTGLESLTRALAHATQNARLITASSPEQALETLKKIELDIAIVDLSLNRSQGVEAGYALITDLTREAPACRIIVLTGHAGTEFGVRALSLGAAHFLAKPADINHLNALIRDGIEQSRLRRQLARFQQRQQDQLARKVIGISSAAQRLREEIRYAASSAQAVFIRGETGTGKGLCAQLIHQMSDTCQNAFIRYQPLGGSADLTNSDLFGHRRGAFTGATENRTGLLLSAHRGTLFLDEIDELPRESQVALLGVLHDRTYRALGDNQICQADFRLISASNAEIESRIESGDFRRDLFHRIAHHQITIPALRERREDIELLCAFVIETFRSRHGMVIDEISPEALTLLKQHHWPGNIRELQAVIENALWKARYHKRSRVETADLTLERPSGSTQSASLRHQVEAFEQQLVVAALNAHQGNCSAAARSLGIDRGTVRRISARL